MQGESISNTSGKRSESKAMAALRELIQGARPVIYLCTSEEVRARELLDDAALRLFPEPVPVWSWTSTRGLADPKSDDKSGTPMDAAAILDFIAGYQGPAIFQLRDFHSYMMASSEIRRKLRDLYEICLDTHKFTVITSPMRALPEELSRQIAFLELLHPDLEEMIDFLGKEMRRLGDQGFPVDLKDSSVFRIGRALQGLTVDEARHALRRALAISGGLDGNSTAVLLEEKKLIVNQSGGLINYVSDGTNIDCVGGMEYLKTWLKERRKLFMERDGISAEIVPKGVLIMGVSGCGKSLAVKAIAECFSLPLYRIDMIEVFSGRHGSPDGAFAEACRMVDSLSPAVVWFDEIEMGLTGQGTEAGTNLGRIFAFFLTWMQEKGRGLFVAATANRIDLLPAEMIRKGRFDEVFFVDLPTEEERIEIFRIHLKRRNIDPDQLEVSRLRRITQGWTGAEIEQCVVSALTTARIESRSMSFEELHRAAVNVIPLSKTMREQVEHIRSWAYDRAVRASPRENNRP
jgi:SpoVK/Ycf46/Vps4 family AAA+-type ATPase